MNGGNAKEYAVEMHQKSAGGEADADNDDIFPESYGRRPLPGAVATVTEHDAGNGPKAEASEQNQIVDRSVDE